MILEKGIVDNDVLWKWYKKTNEGKVERKSGSVVLCNLQGEEVKRWNFFRAFPCRWIGPALCGSDRRTYAVEKIEIAYEWLEPYADNEDEVEGNPQPIELKSIVEEKKKDDYEKEKENEASSSYLYQKYKENLVKDDVLNNSHKIIDDKDLNDKVLIKELTKDGSNINDWAKMESDYLYQTEYGSGKIHYYYNAKTNSVNYYDCKMKIKIPKELKNSLDNTYYHDKDYFWILDLDSNMIPVGIRK